jgi:uncharacterized membrane protein YraQ (UPF0718 family)
VSVRRRRTFDWSLAVIAGLAGAAALAVYLRQGPERFLAILFSGCLIGAFVTLLLPREAVSSWVGADSGVMGLVFATVIGAVLPGGPFTIYPVAAALLAAGADAGAAVTFITSWTLLGYARAVVWELPFFGPDFVIWRILLSLPLPILAGLLARLAWRAVLRRKQP